MYVYVTGRIWMIKGIEMIIIVSRVFHLVVKDNNKNKLTEDYTLQIKRNSLQYLYTYLGISGHRLQVKNTILYVVDAGGMLRRKISPCVKFRR